MSLKFCANLNFLFTENGAHMLDRFRLASKAGFRAVEIGLPVDNFGLAEAIDVQKETGLKVILINIFTGNVPGEEFGVASIPQKENQFQQNFHKTLEYAKALKCKKIHVMGGKLANPPTQDHHDTYVKNLRYAENFLRKENIVGVIEPISQYGVPGYYLNSYDRAIEIVKEINSPHIKLMIDLYHLQHIQGNISNTLKELQAFIGHIQIAQVPNRNEPDTLGEINYSYIFKLLEDSDYKEWIGCEYKPKQNSTAGLKWIQDFGYNF